MDIKAALHEYIGSLPVIDTHEHLENERNQPDWNVLSDYTRHYFSCDLISAGLAPERIAALADPEFGVLEKWNSVEKYWEACRYTGYGQALDIAVHKLYGVPEIIRETIETVEAGYQKLRAEPGYSRRILSERCGIERVMNNIWHLEGDSDGGLYWFVTQIDNYIAPERAFFLDCVKQHGEFANLEAWVGFALERIAGDVDLRGAKALKLGIAYRRCLRFDEPDRESAQAAYAAWLRGEEVFSVIKPMQDYVAHAIFRWANERDLIMQVHTGYQESNAARIADTEPGQLINVILKYPKIRFDLFHMGFPYQDVAGAMGKMYPNVRLNMCWTHMLNPRGAVRALGEWLQYVPRNKIFAFGGDCLFYDGVVGHLELACRGVAEVLAEMVDCGVMSMKKAKETARMMFYDNPREFYGMGDA